MSFFYNLNKRLADLSAKQDAAQLAESKQAETVAQSPLTQALNESDYSAKKAAAGKDIGKPGKNFAKIAKGAAERYGSKAAGERVAGAVLNKLRQPKEDVANEGMFGFGMPKTSVSNNRLMVQGDQKAGNKVMAALQKANPQLAAQGKHSGASGPDGPQYLGIQFPTPQLAQQAAQALQGGMEEGNSFTAALAKTPKGGKFKVGGKEFTDTSSLEEGFKEMDAWMASREKEKGTGKFDRKERTLPGGMKATTYTRKHEDDEEDKDDSKSDQAEKYASPKKKGRPMGKPKGPERITKGAWKHKAGRKEKTKEDLDSDGVMMTRPTNCSSESIENPGEYDQEGAMAKSDMHTVIRHAEQLEQHLQDAENLPTWVIEKLGQIKGMMTSVSDYIISSHERGAEQATGQEGIRMGEGWRGGMHGEPSVVKTGKKDPNAKVEAWNGLMAIVARGQGMEPAVLKHLKQIARTLKPEELELDEEKVEAGKREFFDRLAPAAKKAAKVIKAIAKNRTPVEEESTDKEDTKAERAGKKVAKDIEHDEGDKAKGDNKAEKAGKRVTKDIEYDDKKEKKDDKEEKVEETTVSGSVATATTGGKSSKGGMSFGKGVYESLDKQFKQALTESIQVKSSMEECGDGEMAPALTIQADGEEAAKLMMLLKLAGLENQIPQACPTCGGNPCGCAEVVDENSPDWPTNTEKLDAEPNLRTYSGGLNGPKSSGQTTTPILNRDPRRQASMEESVALERSLFKTWKKYKG